MKNQKKTFEHKVKSLLSKYSSEDRRYIRKAVRDALTDGEYLATISVHTDDDITTDVIYDVYMYVCKGIDREKEQDRQTQIRAFGEIRF